MNKKKFTKQRKTAIAALCAIAVTCTGLAAACSPSNNDNDDDTSSSSVQREDTQLLRNGNFEFSGVIDEDAVHLIKNVSSWSRSGDSSGTKSGIINTSVSAWEKMADKGLRDRLDANNELDPKDDGYEDAYVDYNGMTSSDILYRDSYVAGMSISNLGNNKTGDYSGYAVDEVIRGGGKQSMRTYEQFLGIEGNADEGFTFLGETVYYNADDGDYYFDEDFIYSVRHAVIENPETHLGAYEEKDGKYYLGDTQILVDEDGNYWLDTNSNGEVDELDDETTGNVLMVHNYPTNNKYNGIAQHYASQSITLEANTAAEISVWVKTSNLKFDKGYLQNDPERPDQDRGAYIEVSQTVGSTAVDSFKIKAINTEKIIADAESGKLTLAEGVESNGWLKYTVYVNACDFASSTITINLGLGDGDNAQKVTGYAFFDDVSVTKFIDLTDEDCTYTANSDKIITDTDPAYCSLTSEEDEKIFYADRQIRGEESLRFADRFFYLLDLASENYAAGTSNKAEIDFSGSALSTSISLTTQESGNKTYASAMKNNANISGFDNVDANEYELPEVIKNEGRPTFNDLIGIYKGEKEFGASDFSAAAEDGLALRELWSRLNPELYGERGAAQALSNFSRGDSMIVMLSAYGATYTATLESTDGTFTLPGYDAEDGKNYKIISFWIKTSDTNGKTAATVKLIDVDDEDKATTLTVNSTNITTDVGENEDIYSGWVQCFFFVHNDTDAEKTFKIEFSYGNTSVVGVSGNAYTPGWIAMANMQTLDVDEEIFNLVPSSGTFSSKFTFDTTESASKNVFDEANGMTSVKNGVARPSSYNGVNGGSSYVTDKKFSDDYDMQNSFAGGFAENKDGITGLINKEGFDKYDESVRATILGGFITGATSWNEVFGNDCYQPLIIVNSLRQYMDRAQADVTESNYKDFYVKDEDGNYVHPEGTWEEHKDDTFYSLRDVVNYGYMGATQTISANSFKTVSVKVLVSEGAEAYIYLVDPSSRAVMKYETPEISYYYDDLGNVLDKEYDEDWTDAEHREAIIYTLRDDGMYEGKDGTVRANLTNLTKRFKYSKYENRTFYTKVAEGVYELISYDDLQDDVIYYSDANGTIADHYLVVGEQRIYEWDSATAAYYYIKTADGSKVKVEDFEHEYARHSAEDYPVPEYCIKVTDTHGEWVTVNFIIQTGNVAKDYRLELWSGRRDEAGEASSATGAVAFDYSSAANSITSSNYADVLKGYTDQIIKVYTKLIADNDPSKLTPDATTIADFEAILDDIGIDADARAAALEAEGVYSEYEMMYYTFTLYDSASFVPFNKEAAEAGQTGYDYSVTDYSETLAYFFTRDNSDNSYNMFVDYSAVDQSVDISTSNEDDHDHGTEDDDKNGGEGWLLITSIVLVVVLLFVLIAMLVRFLWKKYSKKRGQKDMQKNNYKQRERYIRKLGLVKAEPVEEEPEAPSTDEAEDEAPAEEPETEAVEEETPAEEATEETATETPADDTKDE